MKLYNKSSHGQPNPAMPLDHTAWCKSTVWHWWTSSKGGKLQSWTWGSRKVKVRELTVLQTVLHASQHGWMFDRVALGYIQRSEDSPKTVVILDNLLKCAGQAFTKLHYLHIKRKNNFFMLSTCNNKKFPLNRPHHKLSYFSHTNSNW